MPLFGNINWAPNVAVRSFLAKYDAVVNFMGQLVAIPTVTEQDLEGFERALALLRAQSAAFKLPTIFTDSHNRYGYVEVGNPQASNLIVIPTHLDVVPPGPAANWLSGDPYNILIKDGNIYGRGTIDDKGPAAITLYTLGELAQYPFKSDVRVRAVFLTHEEIHPWPDVEAYIEAEGYPTATIVPDSGFQGLSEKARFVFKMTGIEKPIPKRRQGAVEIVSISTDDNVVNRVPACVRMKVRSDSPDALASFTNRIRNNFSSTSSNNNASLEMNPRRDVVDGGAVSYEQEIVVFGKAAHASIPWKGSNAVQVLAKTMEGVKMVDNQCSRFIHLVQTGFGYDWEGESLGLARKGESNFIEKQTVNLGVVQINGGKFYVEVDARLRLDADSERVVGLFEKFAERNRCRMVPLTFMGKIVLDPDSSLFKTAAAAYERHSGKPTTFETVGGRTQAFAFVPPVGADAMFVGAFAFGMRPPDEAKTAHMTNEFMSLEAVQLGMATYFDLLWALAVDHNNPGVQELKSIEAALEGTTITEATLDGLNGRASALKLHPEIVKAMEARIEVERARVKKAK